MTNFEYWLRYKAMDKMPEVILFTLLATFVFGLYPAMKYLNTYECQQYEAVTGRETKMVDLNCYIHYDGEWYRANEVKIIRKTRGE